MGSATGCPPPPWPCRVGQGIASGEFHIMTRSHFPALLLSGIAPFALLSATEAKAEDSPAKAPAAAPADASDEGDIVVTAQRRSENAQNVPIAISVLKPDALHDFQSAGSDTLLSLSGRVPSLYVESTTGRIFPR